MSEIGMLGSQVARTQRRWRDLSAVLLLLRSMFSVPIRPNPDLAQKACALRTLLISIFLAVSSNAQAETTFPIANSSGPEASFGAAFDGTNFLVGIQGDASSAQNVTAQLVSKTGALVGSRISTGAKGGGPQVAFDGTNYLLAWGCGGSVTTCITGQFVSTSGALVGAQFTIATGRDIRFMMPSIVFDGTNYFVSWEDRNPTSNSYDSDLFGQFITTSGAKLGSVISITSVALGQRDHAIAFDGTNILAIWGDGRNHSVCYASSSGCERDLYGQLIAKSGSFLAGALSGGNFLINSGTWPLDNPKNIAFDGTNYLITYIQQEPTTSGNHWEAYGLLVSKTGAPLGSPFVIGNAITSTKFLLVPVYLGSKYLVTWTDSFGTISPSIKGQYVSPSGAVDGAEFTLFAASSSGAVPWINAVLNGGGVTLAVTNWGTPDAIDQGSYVYASTDVTGSIITPTLDSGAALNMVVGWNLVGNSVNAPLDVTTTLADASKVTSVWKWVSTGAGKWAFFSPALTGQALSDYAASKGYDVLTTIIGGEGFWVNAKTAFTAQLPASAAVTSASFQNMSSGWHLVATGDTQTPGAFNAAMSVTPPSAGAVPQNITTLWAWDSALSKWYFYAPSLEAQGGSALSNYITSHGYLDFTSANKTLGLGVGFWVNKL